MESLQTYSRYDIVNLLEGSSNIGVELGIAEGVFASKAVASNQFRKYIGVDMYSDRNHDLAEYKRALSHVGLFTIFSLLKMKFIEALDLFPKESIDFLYIDGYAHTGEEEGTTLYDWYPKVRSGGIFAGDDYCARKWPLVFQHVNRFCAEKQYEVSVTGVIADKSPWSQAPSWVLRKR